ncbi:hypothetical protein VTL71DRAFT_15151 [Oculimacula yallundae]|uniref:Uncharacterized protein n=1 Tax=Oculimacula yallundae TaxID=86028 RepID=A0ABR4CHY6_9HELO
MQLSFLHLIYFLLSLLLCILFPLYLIFSLAMTLAHALPLPLLWLNLRPENMPANVTGYVTSVVTRWPGLGSNTTRTWFYAGM